MTTHHTAVFVSIQQGQGRVYHDSWAGTFLFRNLVWGPEALEQWLAEEGVVEEEDNEWLESACGGAIIDHDRKRLTWQGDDNATSVPHISHVLDRLLQAAWPGYQIQYAVRGTVDLMSAAAPEGAQTRVGQAHSGDLEERHETVDQAALFFDVDDDDDFDDDNESISDCYDEHEIRAWVTVLDDQGVVHHRYLSELSLDLIAGDRSAIASLLELEPVEVPPECVVREGLWLDFSKQRIGYWGGWSTPLVIKHLRSGWRAWQVKPAANGYQDQCRISGPEGIPMSDARALAELVPKILSTKRIDLSSVIGVVGGQLKRVAVRVTGCLTVLICTPFLVLGLIFSTVQTTLLGIGLICAIVFISFKLLEAGIKVKFNEGPIGEVVGHEVPPDARPPVAGPLDAKTRRQRLDELLADAGLPSLTEMEESVPPNELSEFL